MIKFSGKEKSASRDTVMSLFQRNKHYSACFLALTMLSAPNQAHAHFKNVTFVTELHSREGVQQKTTIIGKVTDDNGAVLRGVSIQVKGPTNVQTTTDNNGRFVLEVPKNSILEVRFVGYISQEVQVTDNKTELTIVLVEDTQNLEEVTVTGFGAAQKKSTLVGSITTIKPEELKIPTSNLSNSIAGKMAGVVAFQRSGEPGADGASFYIRGISTFSGINSPLIIIDGVPASAGDLNALAAETIESFSILKDANATAMYGTRGANGVMLVTTKRGKNLDKARINFRLENSITAPTKVPKFADGARFMELFNEAVTGRGTGERLYTQDKIDGTRNKLNPYLYPDVDWYGAMFKDHSQSRAFNANIQGGGAKVDYFMSATLNMDDGVLKSSDVNSFDNNIKVNRYSFQNNLFANLTSTTVASLKLNTQLRDYRGPNSNAADIFGNAINANPVDFPIMFPDNDAFPRSVLFGGKTGGRINNGFLNPYASMVNGYKTNFQSTVSAVLDINQKLDVLTEGLSVKGVVSFKNWSQTQTRRYKGVNQFEISDYVVDADGNYTFDLDRVGSILDETLATENTTGGDRSVYLEGSVNYQRTFGDLHDVNGVLVYYQTDYNVNAPSDLLNSLPRRTQSYSGRFAYAYDNRYLFQGTFGYNGSESFIKGKKFGFFPSVGAGYIVSNEAFFEPLRDKIHNLKLRGSWGISGNDQITLADGSLARFIYLSDINLQNASFNTGVSQDYSRSGPTYNRFQNNDITWELSEQINLGLELGLFNSLNIVAEVYKEDRTNIFLERKTIPDYFGTKGTTIYSNLGHVKAKGLDVSMDYFKQFSDDFSMAFKGTFTYATNKVVAYDEPAFMKHKNLKQEGHAINTALAYQAERLFIDNAEVAASPLQQIGGFIQGGDIKYFDYNNDGLINSDDRVRMGYPTNPEIVYGFGPSFKYKNLDFSLFFQGVGRTSLMMSGFHPFGTSDQRNVLDFIADDHWSPSNPNIYSAYPRLSKLDNPNNTTASSYWLRSGDFLKLKNAEVGYKFKSVRVYMSGLNLLTFSKFKHWDPEQGGGSGLKYPTQRVVNIGLQMTFN